MSASADGLHLAFDLNALLLNNSISCVGMDVWVEGFYKQAVQSF